MGYIYVLTNKLNGKKYIGQSQQADIKSRWRSYHAMKKHSIGTVLLNALKKNGIDNFKFQIICICFDEDCNQYEKDYIKKYNTMKPNGYNMQDGGKNPSITCRKKIVLSDEEKEKRKGRFLGEKSANFGKPISDEQKKKLSEAVKRAFVDSKFKTRASSKGHVQKAVQKCDINHVVLETYPSILQAAASFGTSPAVIKRYAIEGKFYRGFYWKLISAIGVKKTVTPPWHLAVESVKKRVHQFDINQKFIASHTSISEAARTVNGCISTLSKCASEDEKHKRYKTHKGFVWSFKGPEEPPKKKQTKASREYKSFLRNPDGSIATLC